MELGADEFTGDGFAEDLAPVAFGLAVVHDEDVADKFAGNAEGIFLVVNLAGIHDARKAERSPSDGDGDATNGIVDDFVTAEEGDGVGAGFAIEFDADDEFVGIVEVVGFGGGEEGGVVEGGDGVAGEDADDFIVVVAAGVKGG